MKRNRSTLAELLQVTTFSLLVCALAWLAWSAGRSSWIRALGVVLIVFGYSAILALEFLALRFVNRIDPAAPASWSELAVAWLGATAQGLRVFLWRQPFRWRAYPDRVAPGPALRGRRGVIFIHGFVCNRGFWTPWLALLSARKNAFVAVNLEPVNGSIDEYVRTIDQAVALVTEVSGLPPMLVCHSMGGLAARAWLRAGSKAGPVHHIVTIGTPHRGTWLARFSRLPSGRQMALASDWLRELEAHPGPQPEAGFTCWYSNCDNIVFPSSCATLPGADNRLVHGVSHVDLAFQPQVMAATLALLHSEENPADSSM